MSTHTSAFLMRPSMTVVLRLVWVGVVVLPPPPQAVRAETATANRLRVRGEVQDTREEEVFFMVNLLG
jgi:hypothetical protein